MDRLQCVRWRHIGSATKTQEWDHLCCKSVDCSYAGSFVPPCTTGTTAVQLVHMLRQQQWQNYNTQQWDKVQRQHMVRWAIGRGVIDGWLFHQRDRVSNTVQRKTSHNSRFLKTRRKNNRTTIGLKFNQLKPQTWLH